MPAAPMRYERGALNLLWCAVLMGVVAVTGLFGLMSMRQERHLFDEARVRFMNAEATRSILSAVDTIKPAAAPIRKCVNEGKTVYSNTGCKEGGQTGRALELHDTHGVQAPELPASDRPAHDAAPGLRDRMIDRTVSR